MIKITYNGRPFDPDSFAEDIKAKPIEVALQAVERKARGAASSIVDPETGRHADVFVDRLLGNRVSIRTSGSLAYARLLEVRLGVGAGEVKVEAFAAAIEHPKVYLAHASDDKAIVRPVAEFLMANGVDVWFDEWEIEPGDSLRQKMEEGLGTMTHFLVVLTPSSIKKPWVAKEIDVGMVRQVGGESRFVPVVVGVPREQLSPFLQSMLYVEIDPTNEAQLKGLVDRLHGVSRKPPLGSAPVYVDRAPEGLGGWSPAAVAVGKHLVEASSNAMPRDPVMTIDELAEGTGIDLDDIRVAVLDLKDAGYLWESSSIRGHVSPECGLFVEFDEAFMLFNPSEDARVVANRMVTNSERATGTQALAEELGWHARRMNSAICYLLRAGAIEARHALAADPWRAVQLIRTDQTLRFARSHS